MERKHMPLMGWTMQPPKSKILPSIVPDIWKYMLPRIIEEEHSERTLYRTLERIGKQFPIILQRYQDFIKENNLISKEQFIDFSSTYLEGKNSELAKFGYSRYKRSDKPQINFGISTGINNIPTAITHQR